MIIPLTLFGWRTRQASITLCAIFKHDKTIKEWLCLRIFSVCAADRFSISLPHVLAAFLFIHVDYSAKPQFHHYLLLGYIDTNIKFCTDLYFIFYKVILLLLSIIIII